MSQPAFRVEPLDAKRHDRESFESGVAALDGYLRTHASQDMRRKANAVFVLVGTEQPSQIIGYFTLCATALDPGVVPESARKHVPRYPLVSATLIGRFAIDARHQRKGLGGMLLVRALRMAHTNASIVGSCMVVVDAIDETARRFYEAHGFVRLPESMRLILPMRSVEALFRQ